MLMQGKPALDHVGYSIADGPELLRWADYLSRNQITVLWGPGRDGAGNDLFLRFAEFEGPILNSSLNCSSTMISRYRS